MAILLVLLSHGSDVFAQWCGLGAPAWLSPAGFFGVELFFVLSGFLIGRLLLGLVETRPSVVAWWRFMLRRWMRTLPVYWLWLAILAVVWPPRFWEPGHAALTWRYVASYGMLTQNLAWPMPDWFGVSWSLTVEEWFYLGFSAPLFGAVAVFGRRAGFLAVLGLFLAVPPALRLAMPDSVDFGRVLSKVAVSRLDAIAFGVVLAWAAARRGWVVRHPGPCLALGLATILALWAEEIDASLLSGPALRRVVLFDLASAGFMLCLPAAAALRRLPRWPGRAVAALSTRAYPLYLVHLSVLEIVGYYKDRWAAPAWLAIALSLALIWALASASWRWIEAPILARRPRQLGGRPAGDPALIAGSSGRA